MSRCNANKTRVTRIQLECTRSNYSEQSIQTRNAYWTHHRARQRFLEYIGAMMSGSQCTYECKTSSIWNHPKLPHKLPQLYSEMQCCFQRDCFAGLHQGWRELIRMHLTKRHIFGATLCLSHVLLMSLFYRCRIVCLIVGAACRATGTFRHIWAQA